jgi:hypothetical protein
VHLGTVLPPFRTVAGVVPLDLLDCADQLSLAQFADPDQPDHRCSFANFLHVHSTPPSALTVANWYPLVNPTMPQPFVKSRWANLPDYRHRFFLAIYV